MARRTRALTETVETSGVAVVVEKWYCEEHSALKKVGAQAKTTQKWRVRALGRGDKLVEEEAIESVPSLKEEDEAFGAVKNPTTDGDGQVSDAIDIEVLIDQGLVSGAALGPSIRVGTSTQSELIFPPRGAKARTYEDLRHEWNFRGIVSGIGLIGANRDRWIPGTIPTDRPLDPTAHAIQDKILGQSEIKALYEVEFNGKRYPCVLKKQRPDGCFEVAAFQPDLRGILEIKDYPSLPRSNIFESGKKEHIAVPEVLMALDIPKANPHNMTLTIDGDNFKDYLGRVSPPNIEKKVGPRIYMDCPKRWLPIAEQVKSAAMGIESEEPIKITVKNSADKEPSVASVLSHFLSGEVRRGEVDSNRLAKWWELQLGPFAEHKIRLEKKIRTSPILTLIIDDDILCECAGEDLECSPEEWRCKFTFMGERYIDFNVHEETKDLKELDDKSVMTKTYCYDHSIEVVYARRNIDDFNTCELYVDGVNFLDLNQKVVPRDKDAELSISRRVMFNQFGLEVPHKIRNEDTRGTARKIAGRVWHDMGVEWSVREGPLKETLQEKAGEAGNLMQNLGGQMLEFLSLQSSQWSSGAWSSGGSWGGIFEGCTAQVIDDSTEVAVDSIVYAATDDTKTGGYPRGLPK